MDAPAAVASVFTKNMPALFEGRAMSIALATGAGGPLVILRREGEAINVHLRHAYHPQAVARRSDRLVAAERFGLWHFADRGLTEPDMGDGAEPNGGSVETSELAPHEDDACLAPLLQQVTGNLDIQDMAFDDAGQLWAASKEAGIGRLTTDGGFHPAWRPEDLAQGDSGPMQVSGMALRDGKPRYALLHLLEEVAVDPFDPGARGGWLVDIEDNAVLLRGLPLPFAPVWANDQLYFLEGGTGRMARHDAEHGTWRTVLSDLPGMPTAMVVQNDLAFVGVSRLFEGGPPVGRNRMAKLGAGECGLWVIHLEQKQIWGFLRFDAGIDRVTGIAVLEGWQHPEVLGPDEVDASEHAAIGVASVGLGLSSETPAMDQGQDSEATTSAPAEAEDAEASAVDMEESETPAGPALGQAMASSSQTELDSQDEPDKQAKQRRAGRLKRDGKPRKALLIYEEIVAEHPEDANAYNELANCLADLNRLDEAIEQLERAIELSPETPGFPYNLSMILIRNGDLKRGFELYEQRFDIGNKSKMDLGKPEWEGESLVGKSILIYVEQGYGDGMQFARFFPDIAQRAAGCTLVCLQGLSGLLGRMPGIDAVVSPGAFEAHFDCWIPAMSIPRVLGTTLETLPAEVPYLTPPSEAPLTLEHDPERPFKVGIVWAGNPDQGADRHRSAGLEAFLPILQVPGVSFYSLQVGKRHMDLARLPDWAELEDLSPHIQSWDDTAALVDQLDLVIGVDTGCMHLVGSLGKEGWLMLCHSADWRWFLDREDCPWYPTLRLFRQPAARDWASVSVRVAEALRERVQDDSG